MHQPIELGAAPSDLVAWRHQLHAHPEIGFDLPRTSAFVAERLRAFGCEEVHEGIGGSGVVGVIEGRPGAGVIGLRSDMDALPILELTGKSHASLVDGRMHGCGHDGHMVMLLGAARQLCATRHFFGRAVLVFQPAEEIGQGAKAMLADGLMERFGIQRIFGMHNMPGIPVGQFAINPGPMMAAVAKFTITIEGKGGHAARPYQTRDPIVAAAQLVEALQQVVSRNADPVGSLVVSVTRIAAGTAYNIIPETTEIWGTTRALDMADAKLAQERIAMICEGMGKATGTSITLDYDQAHPVALNDPREAAFAASVARRMVGAHKVDGAVRPSMAGEDFSHMLTARPGAFIFIGNGDSQGLHHPAYDFDDGAIPAGVAYWVGLVEAALPAA